MKNSYNIFLERLLALKWIEDKILTQRFYLQTRDQLNASCQLRT